MDFVAITTWTCLWFILFGLPTILKKFFSIYYTDYPFIFISYYISCIFIIYASFDILYLKFFFSFDYLYLPYFILFIIFCFCFQHIYIHKVSSIPKYQLDNSIFAKFAEVLLQQVMLSVLFYIFYSYLHSSFNFYIQMIIFFVAIHIPLVYFINNRLAWILIFSATIGMGLLSYIFINFQDAFLISYVLHIVFYITLSIFYTHSKYKKEFIYMLR